MSKVMVSKEGFGVPRFIRPGLAPASSHLSTPSLRTRLNSFNPRSPSPAADRGSPPLCVGCLWQSARKPRLLSGFGRKIGLVIRTMFFGT